MPYVVYDRNGTAQRDGRSRGAGCLNEGFGLYPKICRLSLTTATVVQVHGIRSTGMKASYVQLQTRPAPARQRDTAYIMLEALSWWVNTRGFTLGARQLLLNLGRGHEKIALSQGSQPAEWHNLKLL